MSAHEAIVGVVAQLQQAGRVTVRWIRLGHPAVGEVVDRHRLAVWIRVRHALAQTFDVVATLEQRERAVVGSKRVARASPEVSACTEPECWRAAAEAARVDHLVDLRVTKSGPDFDLQLRLVDGSTGTLLASAERTCEICGFAEMTQTLGEMVSGIGRRVGEASVAGVLAVTAVPVGARVRLDGRLVGTAPLELPVEPGERSLRIARSGYIGRKQPVLLTAGTTSHVDVELQPRPGSRLRTLGWVGLAAGVAATGAGVTLLTLDGREARSRCAGPDVDDDGDCRYRHATMPIGAASVAAGGLLLGAAVTLLVLASRTGGRGRARAAVSAGGLSIEGRF